MLGEISNPVVQVHSTPPLTTFVSTRIYIVKWNLKVFERNHVDDLGGICCQIYNLEKLVSVILSVVSSRISYFSFGNKHGNGLGRPGVLFKDRILTDLAKQLAPDKREFAFRWKLVCSGFIEQCC